jgi:DNA repair ATPase RecN
MIERGEDRRTEEEKQLDEDVQQALEDGTFSRLSPEEHRLSRLRALARKHAEQPGAAPERKPDSRETI